jgi:hypothetical protein
MVAFAESAFRSRSVAAPSSMIVARAESAARELESWMLSAEAQALPVHRLEVEQERRAREVQRLWLQANLEARGLGDVGEAVIRQRDGAEERLGCREQHTRHLATVFGEVAVHRWGYRARAGGASVHPLDQELELPERVYSQEVQRRIVRAAIQGPYDEAAERLAESTGLSVSKQSAEAVVADAARDVDAFYAQRRPLPAEETGAVLVGAVDGKGIPMRKPEKASKVVRRRKGEKANKKRMATVAAVFTRDACVRTPEEVVESLFAEGPRPPGPPGERSYPEQKRVFASLKQPKDEVIGEMAAEMRRRDPACTKTWACVCDGEQALQRRVDAALPGAVLVLDLLHVLSYLWKAAYVFHAEGSREARDWVRRRTLWILEGRVSQVIKGLRQSVTKRELRGVAKETLLGVANYYWNNRSRMKYDVYLAAGLPIASGAVEGACKHIVKDRMERTGMRWSEDGAEAMLKLRATYLSRDFDEYWDFHVQQEQQRLHPPALWRPLRTSA